MTTLLADAPAPGGEPLGVPNPDAAPVDGAAVSSDSAAPLSDLRSGPDLTATRAERPADHAVVSGRSSANSAEVQADVRRTPSGNAAQLAALREIPVVAPEPEVRRRWLRRVQGSEPVPPPPPLPEVVVATAAEVPQISPDQRLGAPETAPAARPQRVKKSWREQRWERRRKRRAMEEVLGWILVPVIVIGCYWAVKGGLAAVGTTPTALFQQLKAAASGKV